MFALKKHAETLGFLYAFSIVIILFVFTSERVFFTSSKIAPPSSSGTYSLVYPSFDSPLVGRKNASSVITSHVNRLKLQFENMLSASSYSWQVLRDIPGMNLSVSVHYGDLMDDSGRRYRQPYIKSSILIKAQPKEVYKMFMWRHLHDTLQAVDPLYESSKLVSKVSANTNILRKTTKRLIIFPKRELFLAHSLFDQRSPIHVSDHHIIPSGSLVASFVNIQLSQNDYKENKSSGSHVQASQDYFAWFSKVKTNKNHKNNNNKDGNHEYGESQYPEYCTLMTTISRLDLGLSIPRWPLETTMTSMTAGFMISLKKIVEI